MFTMLERYARLSNLGAVVRRLAPLLAFAVLLPVSVADAQRIEPRGMSSRAGSHSDAAVQDPFDDARQRCRRRTIIRHSLETAFRAYLILLFVPIATDRHEEKLALHLGATGVGALVGAAYGANRARGYCAFPLP